MRPSWTRLCPPCRKAGCSHQRRATRKKGDADTWSTFCSALRRQNLWRRQFVPELASFDYAVLRVVPRVERGEFLNAGLILFCPELRFLQCGVQLDEACLLALCSGVDVETIRRHLDAFSDVCEGKPDAGPIAQLPQRQRFHWLVAPRSTVIQVSPVHTGLCTDPEATFLHL